jgi:hypothetical protein
MLTKFEFREIHPVMCENKNITSHANNVKYLS